MISHLLLARDLNSRPEKLGPGPCQRPSVLLTQRGQALQPRAVQQSNRAIRPPSTAAARPAMSAPGSPGSPAGACPAPPTPTLHYQQFTSQPAAAPCSSSTELTALILPGVTAHGPDYAQLASRLAAEASRLTGRPWRVLAVDLRHHGRSQGAGWAPPSDIPAVAADVARLLGEGLGGLVPEVVIGHSLGAKVALELLGQLGQLGQQGRSEARSEGEGGGGSRGASLPKQVGTQRPAGSARLRNCA